MTKIYWTFTFFFIALFYSLSALSQDEVIRLKNPSFEDLPRASKAPADWYDCGFPGESPPDVQPEGTFSVTRLAYDGATYMGMVVRDNDSWERVSQRLSKPIQKDQCYNFSIFLCRSPLYESRSQITGRMTNYIQPAKLIIWAGDQHCAKRERLAETDVIKNFEWQRFDFKFEPTQTHSYIQLEAFYETPVLFPYNGNILIDNASNITPISCDDDAFAVKAPEVNFIVPATSSQKVDDSGITVQAQIKNVSANLNISFLVNGRSNTDFYFDPDFGIFQADLRKFREGRNIIELMANNEAGDSKDRAILIYEKPEEPVVAEAPVQTPTSYEAPPPPEKSIVTTPPPKEMEEEKLDTSKEEMKIEGIARENMKTGQIIQLNKLYFGTNDSSIDSDDSHALDEIYRFLKYNTDVAIEIGGHTNGNCDHVYCDELSELRAKAVADYLIGKGIEDNRLQYKGYGKRKPIASNRTAVGRKKNQRVEIKILSIDG